MELIDSETITMYKKLRCERHRYIFYGILKLEVTLVSYLYCFYIWMNTFTQAALFQRNAAFESTLFHLYVQMKGHPYN